MARPDARPRVVGTDPHRQPSLHGVDPKRGPLAHERRGRRHALGLTLLDVAHHRPPRGSYVVPATTATTYGADISAEESEGPFPLLGLVQVHVCSRRFSWTRTHWINADTRAISEKENGAHYGHDDDTDYDDDVDADADREGEDEDPNDDGAHGIDNKPERG